MTTPPNNDPVNSIGLSSAKSEVLSTVITLEDADTAVVATDE